MDLDPKLESALRTSLAARSAEVTPESLTRPRLRPARRRSVRPFVLAAASVVLVVLIAAGGRWALAPSSTRSATPPPVAGASYVGSKFRLTTVETGGKTWSIPAFLSVTVEFTRSHEIVTDDSVNVQSGTFSPTADGFVTHDVVGTLVDFIGGNSAQGAAVKAIGALAVGAADGSGGFAPAIVQAQISGDLLVLRASGYTLSLVRTGPARARISAGPGAGTTVSSVDQCSLPLVQRTGGWTCYSTLGNAAAGSIQVSPPAASTTAASTPAPTTRPGNSPRSRFELPDSSDGVALLIRTDFSNDAVWKAIVADASKNQPMPGMPVNATNVFYNIGLHAVDDRRFEGMTMQQLLQVAPNPKVPTEEEMAYPTGDPDTTPLHAYIVDKTTMTNPEHPILAVNYFLDRGQHFRLAPNAMAGIEINLSIANLGFDDYIASAGPDGIVRE